MKLLRILIPIFINVFITTISANCQNEKIVQKSILTADIDSLKSLTNQIRDEITGVESVLRSKYFGSSLVTKENFDLVNKTRDSLLKIERTSAAPVNAKIELIASKKRDSTDQENEITRYDNNIKRYYSLSQKIKSLQETMEEKQLLLQKITEASGKTPSAKLGTTEGKPDWDTLYGQISMLKPGSTVLLIDSMLRFTHKDQLSFISSVLSSAEPKYTEVTKADTCLNEIWRDYGLSVKDGLLFLESQKIVNLLAYFKFKDFLESKFFRQKYTYTNRLQAAKYSAEVIPSPRWLEKNLYLEYKDLVRVSKVYCGFTMDVVAFLKKQKESGKLPKDLNGVYNLPNLAGIDYYPYLKDQIKKYFNSGTLQSAFFIETGITECTEKLPEKL